VEIGNRIFFFLFEENFRSVHVCGKFAISGNPPLKAIA